MATDGPTPDPCEREIYEQGEVIFVTHSIPSNAMEGWVKRLAAASGQRVDWHFCGGRAVVKALGDLSRVRATLVALMPEHDELQRKEFASLGELRALLTPAAANAEGQGREGT